ncbi:hypothetical protein [Actinomadura sp. WAC 06369]|nr:hypothetical protein [Actinomadura sp. WAC 06369]
MPDDRSDTPSLCRILVPLADTRTDGAARVLIDALLGEDAREEDDR